MSVGVDQIAGIPFSDTSGGGPEQWSCICKFEGIIEPDIRSRTFEAMGIVSGAFVRMTNTGEDTLAFGAVGHMDEAVASAVQTLSPILGPIITNTIRDIYLLSQADAEKQMTNGKDISGFSIVQTVLAHLSAD